MQTCSGHLRNSGQILGVCISCAHLGPNARTQIAQPVQDAQRVWSCPGWVAVVVSHRVER